MFRPHSSLTRLTIAVLVSVLPPLALAGGWEIEPEFTLSSRYEDNPALQPKILDPEATLSTLALFRADISTAEPNSSLEIRPRIQTTYYPESKFQDLNRTDYFLNGYYDYTQQKWTLLASLAYDYQSILSSEDTDPNDPDDGGSGNFLRVDDRRKRLSFTPGLTWNPTLLDTISLTASYTLVDYDLDFTNRADYDSYGLTLNYQRAIANRHSVGFFASAYSTDSDRRGFVLTCVDGTIPELCPGIITIDGLFINNSEGSSFNLSYSYQLSENSKIVANIGRQETEIESGIVVPRDTVVSSSKFKSTQYLLGYNATGERIEWEVNASRNVAPASNGSPSDKTQIQAAITSRHTEKLSSRVAAVGFRQTSRNAFVARQNEYVRIDFSATWQWTRDFSISTTYTYRNRDPELTQFGVDVDSDEAQNAVRKSNTITLALRYKF